MAGTRGLQEDTVQDEAMETGGGGSQIALRATLRNVAGEPLWGFQYGRDCLLSISGPSSGHYGIK